MVKTMKLKEFFKSNRSKQLDRLLDSQAYIEHLLEVSIEHRKKTNDILSETLRVLKTHTNNQALQSHQQQYKQTVL